MDPDYLYFKQLWDQSAAGQNNGKDRSTEASKSRELPARKKKRRFDVASDSEKQKDSAVIENMDLLRDCKEDNEFVKSKRGKYSRAIQTPGARGTDLLYKHLSIQEVDNLVGWATSHQNGNNHGNSLVNVPYENDEADDQEPRVGLSHIPAAPPPPSQIQYLHQVISERLTSSAKNDLRNDASAARGDGKANNEATICNNSNMDTSAYVAVGMAIEEALTAALLPLAEAHVQRCRRLERRMGRSDTPAAARSCTRERLAANNPFHAWVLPPAEAMVQLARDESAGSGNKRSDALA